MSLWLSRNVLYICDELGFALFKNSRSQYLLKEVYYLWHNNVQNFIIKTFLVFPCITKIVSSFIVGKKTVNPMLSKSDEMKFIYREKEPREVAAIQMYHDAVFAAGSYKLAAQIARYVILWVIILQQECIPVWCIPPASVAVSPMCTPPCTPLPHTPTTTHAPLPHTPPATCIPYPCTPPATHAPIAHAPLPHTSSCHACSHQNTPTTHAPLPLLTDRHL